MKKILLGGSGLILIALSTQAIHAKCSMKNESQFQTRQVIMNMGAITLDPNAPIGHVYKTGNFPFSGADNFASCDNSGGYTKGVLIQNKPVTAIKDTYATNVKGIGIRLYRDSNSIKTYYPHQINFTNKTDLNFIAGYFKVDIIKTEATTGTGALTSGLYSTYHLDGTPNKSILTSYLDAEGIQIINPTCSIAQGTENQTIAMGSISTRDLPDIGSTTNARNFSIKLTCNGGNQYIQKVSLGFNYTPDSAMGGNGVISNSAGSNFAKGVGIQLLTNNSTPKQIKNDDSISLGSTVLNQATTMELPLKAQYYRTLNNVTGGKVNAVATFNIEYQ